MSRPKSPAKRQTGFALGIARWMEGSLMMKRSMDGTLPVASIGTRAAASMLTTFIVLLSTPFISMNAAQIFGMNDAVLDPSSSFASFFGESMSAPGLRLKIQYGGFFYVPAPVLLLHAMPPAPPQHRISVTPASAV